MRTQNTSTGNCDSLISAASSLLWVVIYFTSPAQGAATCGSRPALCGFTSGLSRPWKPPPRSQASSSRAGGRYSLMYLLPLLCPSHWAEATSSGFYQLTRKCLIQTISLQRASHLKNCYVVI